MDLSLCMKTQQFTETFMGIGPSKNQWNDIVKIDLVRKEEFLFCSTIMVVDPIMGNLGLSMICKKGLEAMGREGGFPHYHRRAELLG